MVNDQTKRSITYDPVIILSSSNSDSAEECVLPLELKQLYQRIQLPNKKNHSWVAMCRQSLQYKDFLTKTPPTNPTNNINCSSQKDLVASLLLPNKIITTSTCIYSPPRYNSWVSLAFPEVTAYFKKTTHINTHLVTGFTGLDPRS